VGAGLDFGDWYPGEHRRLYASMLVIAGDADLAAEITDEALTRALQHWRRVRAMESPEGWTYRVAVNVMRRMQRRKRTERELHARARPADVVAAPAGEVWDLVRALPDRQRIAVVLRYIADLTEPDVAEVMGVTRGTVASTLADARRALGAVLADSDIAKEPT